MVRSADTRTVPIRCHAFTGQLSVRSISAGQEEGCAFSQRQCISYACKFG